MFTMNILLQCEWEGCEQQVAEWTHPLKFYWHVAWYVLRIYHAV